jgi:hypothetical protein
MYRLQVLAVQLMCKVVYRHQVCRCFYLFALVLRKFSRRAEVSSKNVAYNVSNKPLVIFYTHNLTRKPKNARSKRALDARQPKEVEDARTTIFVKGTHTGEVLNSVMRELVSVIIVISFFFHTKYHL